MNPKMWGSLDLSIAAGVDFPYLLFCFLSGSKVEAPLGRYDDGYIFRWLTMDLAYAFSTRRFWPYFRAFADRKIKDDFVLSDPVPSIGLFLRGIKRMRMERRGRAS
jgi:hypothetical protein